jgi:hypothetical protein
MSAQAVKRAVESVLGKTTSVDRLVNGILTIHEGLRVGAYGQTKYLPASRDFVNYVNGHTDAKLTPEFRRLRGRLGGTTCWVVARHQQSFRRVIKFLCPDMPDRVIDAMWAKSKTAILRTLSESRAGRIRRSRD